MYRIVKESYNNFKEDFLESNAEDDFRYKIMKPFEIIFDLKQWEKEKAIESEQFKKVSDFINYIDENIHDFPEFKVFLRELEARNIVGETYFVLSVEEQNEITKTFKMFLNLTYWH
jgi:hypothetical protein